MTVAVVLVHETIRALPLLNKISNSYTKLSINYNHQTHINLDNHEANLTPNSHQQMNTVNQNKIMLGIYY